MKTSTRILAALAITLIPAFAFAANQASNANAIYVAKIHPMNTNVTGQKTTGKATITIKGDTATIDINVKNAPPGITHWQHFHGFKNGKAATCPTASADANGDGIVDLIETHPASGKTMVPFDDQPAAMDVAHGTYPTASSNGSYTYHKVVSLKKLNSAFAKAFNGAKLDWANRVIYIHGVASDTKLPNSVRSLGPIPAQVTLPIACGNFHLVNK